jgi:hypothetical protein
VADLVLARRDCDWGVEITGFGRPFGLGIDRRRRLYVTDMDLHLVARCDAGFTAYEVHDSHAWSGSRSFALGSARAASPRAPSAWNGPHAIDIDADDVSFVTCYYEPGIHVLDADGCRMATLGHGVLTGPASATLDGHDHLLVAEYAQSAVLRFDRHGDCVGRVQGAFDRPHMARRLADGTIAVADTWNDRVTRCTDDGDALDAGVRVRQPVSLDELPDGTLLVTAWGDDAVVSIDRRGTARRLDTPTLRHPYDARYLDGRLVVADSHQSRVLILNPLPFHGQA